MFIDPDGMSPGQTSWMDGNAHWNFDPNTTIMGGAWFEGNYSLQNSFWNDAAGGSGGFGATTYYGLDGYNYLQSLLNQTYDFSQFDFTKYEIDDPTPKRKYLKNETNFNRWSGIQTTVQQYQLNHENTLLEFKQTIKNVAEAVEYADKISEWSGGITTLKGVVDFIKEGWKSVNPATGILIIGGTVIGIEGEKASQFINMYNEVQDNYMNMHSKDPGNMKGVTVNKTMMIGPQNYIWSQYSFYDIYSHRYLGGGTFN